MINRYSKTQAIILYLDAQPRLFRYGLAILAVVAAAIATRYTPVIGQRAAFMFFFFAIIQAAYWLGRNPGFFAMLLSFIAVNALVLVPGWISNPYDVLILNIGFFVLSVIFITTTSQHRSLTTALWESQQDLNHAQAIAKIGNWRMNVQRNELSWSNENHRIFGIPKGTPLTYESFLVTVHPEDRAYVDQQWQAALRGEPYDIEHRVVVDNKVIWVREHATLEFDSKGILQGGFGITQDVTDRKLIQQELLESQKQYAGILDSAMDTVVTVDSNHNILVFNPAAENMFGYKADEVIGGSLARFIPEEFRHAHDMHITAFGRTVNRSRKMGRAGVVKGRRANGEEFPIEVAISQSGTDGKKFFTAILRDITERQRAESELRERENELRLIMDVTPALISYLDTDFRYLRFNKTYQNWFCLAEDQILGHTAREVIGEKAWGIVHPYLERAKGGEWVRFDYQIPYGTGKPRWVSGNYIPDKDVSGNVKGIVVHVTDIEERKQAELERQKFVSLADNSQEFIGMCDMDFMPFYVNAAGMRLVGLDSLEQALQTPVQDFFFPEDQHFIIEEFFPKVIRERSGEVEIRFRHFQTGAALWMIYNVFFITNYQGESVGLATVSRDITPRKRAEDDLRSAQTRLALVVEEVNAGYWDWDLKTNRLYLSPEWNRQLGLDDDDLLLQWDRNNDRLHPDDRAMVTAATENFIAGRQPNFELQFRLRHKDGSYRWIHSRGALLRDQQNRPYRMLGLNLDITDYMREKELNERRGEMEKSFQLYVATQTAAAIAHELNQPLTAISYYAYVAQDVLKAGNQDPQKLAKVMEKCAEQAQRAGEVIQQLLALLHKGETISEPVDINKSVNYALDLVKAQGYLKAYNIELNLAADLPMVTANALQVQKVLVNLLNNGLEAMNESGRRMGTITVASCLSPNNPALVLVSVCDSGMGVPDSDSLKQMFEPFYTTKATGLGMGLAVSRSLIEAHGGKMWAEKNADCGISVHFTLPIVS